MKTWMICATTGMAILCGAVTVTAAPGLVTGSTDMAAKDGGAMELLAKDGGAALMAKEGGVALMAKDGGAALMAKEGGVQADPLAQ